MRSRNAWQIILVKEGRNLMKEAFDIQDVLKDISFLKYRYDVLDRIG